MKMATTRGPINCWRENGRLLVAMTQTEQELKKWTTRILTANQMALRLTTHKLQKFKVKVLILHMICKGKFLKIFRLIQARRRLKQLLDRSKGTWRNYLGDKWMEKRRKQLKLSLFWLTIFNLFMLTINVRQWIKISWLKNKPILNRNYIKWLKNKLQIMQKTIQNSLNEFIKINIITNMEKILFIINKIKLFN